MTAWDEVIASLFAPYPPEKSMESTADRATDQAERVDVGVGTPISADALTKPPVSDGPDPVRTDGSTREVTGQSIPVVIVIPEGAAFVDRLGHA